MFSNFTNSDLAIVALALQEEKECRKAKNSKKRKIWVHNSWKSRYTEGEYITLYPHLMDDESKFYEYFRMTQATFYDLLEKVEKNLKKNDTFWRPAIEPKQRLAVCLRFLATGDSFKTISFSFRLGPSTVQSIVHHTCRIIVNILLEEVMPVPNEHDWNTIADNFWKMWQFPNCIGALDGKHCVIQAPKKSGSLYFNYKKTFSLVLLALVDAQYNFIAVDVGAYGKNSDAGILANSNLGKSLENESINIPKSRKLPGSDVEVPLLFVGDEGFPLKPYLMRPYPRANSDYDKTIFNYRLCRARRVSENAFGILQQKFRIYTRRLQGTPQNISFIILTTCVLYNFIRKREGHSHIIQEVYASMREQTKDPENLRRIRPTRGKASDVSFALRDLLKSYFVSPAGQVEWQDIATEI